MQDLTNSFLTRSFLRSVWALDFEAFKDTPNEVALRDRLQRWANRTTLKEKAAEAAFIEEFFRQTWGYVQTGQAGSGETFTLWPQFPIAGAGAKGGTGAADLAIGYFRGDAPSNIPQVLCEFKDIRSGLDADQKRKGNTRSPVRQCLDYLAHSRKGMIGSEPIVPTWGLVTDMNEFRLYWYDRGHQQSVRFVIRPKDLFQGRGLLGADEAARFDRFLFAKLFHRDALLTNGGIPNLRELINKRRFRDRELETTFYSEYRTFRNRLYTTLLEKNPEDSSRFPGTRGRLVRLAQKILDRLIFVFFCEDMGQTLAFPPKLLQDFLIFRSSDTYFDPNATTIWQDILRLFDAMNVGKTFGGKMLNQFNGGLFASDPDLEALHVPNSIFCQGMQGQNEASVAAHKDTVLYFCANYNFAADLGTKGDGSKNLGLYTLGRIFEQSITELEILEAEAESRPSLNKEGKRKRDGVYYTPEWVVEKVVDGTLGPRLTEIKRQCGWPKKSSELPTREALDAYLERLKIFTVLDPACGSGAFLITVLRYLVDEMNHVRLTRQEVTGEMWVPDDAGLVRDILRSNIYGVDINAASVEITRLALWLHTARGDKPLSSLDRTVREGNSLIGPDFYKGQSSFYGDEERERINAFDWEAAFPEVFARGGFDAVVGNPPYVKLQNFRTVHADMAAYLVHGPQGLDQRPYQSTRTGNFDLYLPFIEKGLELLNDEGRLGYIAPSLWTVSEYGKGLRELVAKGRNLDHWLDFKSFQIFEEATTYTALQFFTKAPRDGICVAEAPAGVVPPNPFTDAGRALPYGRQQFGERWLLLTGDERDLIDRLALSCQSLVHPEHTKDIFVGLQTSSDAVYHLKKIGPGRYLCSPDGDPKPLPYEVEIEDEVMKPLVSGAEAKRYIAPATVTYLLFPYRTQLGTVELINEPTMATSYPKAWSYLNSFKGLLCLREAKRNKEGMVIDAPFDDARWYRFGRHQNLDKQEIAKLIVAQTVPSLRVCCDPEGESYLNNVRVNGIVAAEGEDLWFLLGVLNAPVADFVFRRIAKVKEGGYFEANRQFIAPLPIPPATPKQRAAVGAGARVLQAAYTLRRDLLVHLTRRLRGASARKRPEIWLFPNLTPKRDRLSDAPKKLNASDARTWASKQYTTDLEAAYSGLGRRLQPGVTLNAELHNGELVFLVDGIPVVERVFVTAEEATFLLAQWKVVASTFSLTEKTTGKKLADALRALAPMTNPGLTQQVIALERELAACEAEIAIHEAKMNRLIIDLYGLTANEERIVLAKKGVSSIKEALIST